MDFNQIMIRLGVDATAVRGGLDQVGAYVKGWGKSLQHHMKGIVGAMFGVAAVEQFFDRVKERILAVDRLARQTGFSTNFVQGAMQKLRLEGENGEAIARPLLQISALAGERGTSGINMLVRLSETWHKLNTEEERNALLKSIGIKNWQMLIPLMEMSTAELRRMDQSGFGFTKIFPENIGYGAKLIQEFKSLGSSFLATSANLLLTPLRGLQYLVSAFFRIPSVFTGTYKRDLRSDLEVIDGIKSEKERLNDVDKDGITLGEKYREVLRQQNDLITEQKDLQNEIHDSGRASIHEMAAEFRRITGIKAPKNYAITGKMMQSFNIETAEEQAKFADMANNEAGFQQLYSYASQLRASGQFTSKDRNPLLRTEQQLFRVNEKLELLKPVAKMADEVLKASSGGNP